MSETATVSDIVSMSIGGDGTGVKTAIGDVLQQKIMVALENRKKDIASSFLTKKSEEVVTSDTSETPQEIESQEIEDGS
tara:strand:- start:222 stop:458 length:237 start_codon:yes stop_codon:yes gene_type:complete